MRLKNPKLHMESHPKHRNTKSGLTCTTDAITPIIEAMQIMGEGA
jgi:hypothetical protein